MPNPFEPNSNPSSGSDDNGKVDHRQTVGWQVGRTKQGAKGVSKTAAIIFGGLLFVLFAGLIAGMILLLSNKQQPYFVSLPIDFGDQTPVPFAEDDAKRMIGLFQGSSENAVNMKSSKLIDDKLKAISAGKLLSSWKEDDVRGMSRDLPFILHVVGFAGLDGAGNVYVIPAEADNDIKKWTPLKSILDAMKQCPSKNKLILLDLARPRANMYRGPLANNIPESLDLFLKKQEALPCAILTSASEAGEESVCIPEVGCSAFAFYITEALTGYADPYNLTRQWDRRVTVLELAEFVTLHVSRWSRNNRYQKQTPKIYRPANWNDFQLVVEVPKPIETDDAALIAPELSKREISTFWAKRKELPAEKTLPFNALVTRWDAAVNTAEVDLLMGTASTANDTTSIWWKLINVNSDRKPAKTIDTLLDFASPAPPAPPASAAAVSTSADKSGQSTSGSASSATSAITPAMANDFAEKQKDLLLQKWNAYAEAKSTDMKFAQFKEDWKQAVIGKSQFAAKVIWQGLVSNSQATEKTAVSKVAIEIDELLQVNSKTFIERIALQKIDRVDRDWIYTSEGKLATTYYLQCVDAISQLLRIGSSHFSRYQQPMKTALEEFASLDRDLFNSASGTVAQEIGQKLKKLTATFTELAQNREKYRQAQRQSQEAYALLSASVHAAVEYDIPPLDTWNELANTTNKLSDLLIKTENEVELSQQAKKLNEKMKQLREQMTPVEGIDGLLAKAKSSKAEDLVRYQALLSTSIPTADERQKLWTAYFEMTKRFHEALRKLDHDDYLSRQPISKPSMQTRPRLLTDIRRADTAILLLKVAGLTEADQLSKELEDVKLLRTDKEIGWNEFGKKLREVYQTINPFPLDVKLKENNDSQRLNKLNRLYSVYPINFKPEKPAESDILKISEKLTQTEEKESREYSQFIKDLSLKIDLLPKN